MIKKLEEIKIKIDKLIKDTAEEQAPLREALATDKANIIKATAKMEEATAKTDIDAYKKAKAEKEDAETIQAMHKARYDAITVKPLMIKEEYQKTADIIIAVVENERKAREKKLCELAEQMNAIAEESSEIQAYANELLHRLQCDIYKCADMQEWEKRALKYKKTEALDGACIWGKCAVNHFRYEEYKKNGGGN